MNNLFQKLDGTKAYYLFISAQYFALALIASNSAIFMLHRGLNNSWLGTLSAISAGTVLAFEFPTGLFADRFGPAVSVVTSFIIRALAHVIMACSYGPWGFCVATFCSNVGYTFFSGAADAWVLDRDENAKNDLVSFYADAGLYSGIARIIGGIAGSMMAAATPALPFWSAAIILAATAWAFWHYEKNSRAIPSKSQLMQSAPPQSWLWKDLKKTLQLVHKDAELVRMTAIGFCFIFACQIPLIYWQPFFFDQKASMFGLGLIYAGFSTLSIFGNIISKQNFLKQFAPKNIFSIAMLFCGVGLLGSVLLENIFAASITLFLAFHFSLGIVGPYRSRILNARIPDARRASVLSMISLVECIAQMLTALFAAFLLINTALPWIFIIASIPIFMAVFMGLGLSET